MARYLEEIPAVLAYSRGTWAAIMLGLIFYFGTLFLGERVIANIDTTGPLGPFLESAQKIIGHRYDKLALFFLLSSWISAIKIYLRDRKRLFGI
jgi:hypothetical protein